MSWSWSWKLKRGNTGISAVCGAVRQTDAGIEQMIDETGSAMPLWRERLDAASREDKTGRRAGVSVVQQRQRERFDDDDVPRRVNGRGERCFECNANASSRGRRAVDGRGAEDRSET